ncbi:MAG TPA: hypothetical protein DCL38_00660 [Lachnospiraceae bacterium]|nr:hypothetical protein [Lachnospiraceae bacterium]
MLQDLKYKFARFMSGRYGMDQFSRFLGFLGFVFIVIGMLSKKGIFTSITLLILIYLYFRMFSRNINKRYMENQRFLELTAKARNYFQKIRYRLSDLRTHHIYTCPSCRQKIRIPRGKGRIEISCPKCSTKFIKNS